MRNDAGEGEKVVAWRSSVVVLEQASRHCSIASSKSFNVAWQQLN